MFTRYKQVFAVISGAVAMLATAAVNGALVSRLDGRAFYDTDRNVTWLANANLAAFEQFGIPAYPASDSGLDPDITGIGSYGAMNWYTAVEFVKRMNMNAYLGVTSWRLPVSQQPDATCTEIDGSPQSTNLPLGSLGYGCYGSELGHLLLELDGGTAVIYDDALSPDPNDPDYAPPYEGFKWMRRNLPYWTQTDIIDPYHTPAAYGYEMRYGTLQGYDWAGKQVHAHKLLGTGFVLPLLDGDINDVLGISTVPVPAAAWLFGSGLVGLVAVARRRA